MWEVDTNIKKAFAVIGIACCLSGCSSTSVAVTESEYDQLKTGMTYAQVSSVIASPPSQSQRESMASDVVRETYTWQNSDGSKLITFFLNGKLLTKRWESK